MTPEELTGRLQACRCMTMEEIQERLRVIRFLTDNLVRDVIASRAEAADLFADLFEAASDPQPDITDEAGK
ncbi:MAG: hypothetical protein IPI58_09725 [Alphaproteobacteria bacterium]|nr:MAG: hypothetical protein IPI58_09725 [Alphaproteobacteria bacterium]